MDFTAKSLKGLFSDVTTVFTRAKQYAEETIGTAERTELDQQYENLAEKADIYKHWTERIVAKLEAVIQPNPNMRYGDLLIEKMGTEIKRNDRLRNLEYLGNDMIDAGIAFNPSTVYGSALVKVGKAQQNLGQTEREFVMNSYRTFIIPFRKFLEEDMKTITKERKVLETKRLDLDAAKSRLRKARHIETQANPKIKPDMIEKELEEAESDLKRAEGEFERQIEITKLLLEGLSSAQANHVRCLNDFVTAQIEFYNQCYRHMLNLQRELSYGNSSSSSSSNRSASFAAGESPAHHYHPHHHHHIALHPFSNHLSATTTTTATNCATDLSISPEVAAITIDTTASTTPAITTTSTIPLTATINASNSVIAHHHHQQHHDNNHQQPHQHHIENLQSRSTAITTATTNTPCQMSTTKIGDAASGANLNQSQSGSISCSAENDFEILSGIPAAAAAGKPRRARCLNDYVAQAGGGELSLRANETIVVSYSAELDPEWMAAERIAADGTAERGKVPVAYLEILN